MSWTKSKAVTVVCRGLTLSCFAFLVALGAQTPHWVHPDCAMYLQIGGLILDGQVPYVDFVEVNPPLVMYLSTIPVAISRWIGVPVVLVFNVLLSVFAGYGAWSLLRHLPRVAPRMSEPHRHVVANLWLGFSFLVFTAGYWALPIVASGTDYGQREHLIVLGYIPLMLVRLVRWRCPDAPPSRSLAIVAGAIAGLVICLKPQFLGAALLVELYLLLENKRFDALFTAEVYAAAAVALLYAVHFMFVPAAMREAFFGRWLPLTASRYAVYHWAWDHVFSLGTLHATVALAIALWLPWREPYRSIAKRVTPFAIFALGSSLVMISQHKGWPYHVIPMSAGICVTLSLIVVEVMQLQVDDTPLDERRVTRLQRGLLSVRPPLMICLMGAWFASVVSNSPVLFDRYRSPTLDLVRKVTKEEDAVMYVSTAVQFVYPEAFHSQRAAGSRFLWTFPLAYLFEGRTTPDAGIYTTIPGREQEQEQLLSELAADVATRKPKLIFIWRGRSCQGCPPGFVISHYLTHHQFEKRALANYTKMRHLGFWDVWARKDVTLPAPGAPR